MVTKLQARQALNTYNFANEELKNKDLSWLERQAASSNPKYDNITTKDGEDGAFIYIRNSQGTKYEMVIDCHEMKVHDIIKINDEVVSIGWIKGFLNDLSDEEQKQALEQIYIQPIEEYLEQRTDRIITLEKIITKNKQGKWQLDLFSKNLISETDICKAVLKNISIESRGIGFSIDPETGEQKLYISPFYFRYEHQDDGSNGHEIGRIKFNNETSEYEGYNYSVGKYEII